MNVTTDNRLAVRRIARRRVARLLDTYCMRQASYLWGRKRIIKPVLLPVQFGDGKQIIAIRPIATRTHHYVVAIHSTPDLDDRDGWTLHDDLDAIYDEIISHFGKCCCEDDDQHDPFKAWPAICLEVGCEWWQLAAGTRQEVTR